MYVFIYVCMYIIVYSTGDITSRLTSDTTTMSNALSLNFNIFIRSFIKAGLWKQYYLYFIYTLSLQNTTYYQLMKDAEFRSHLHWYPYGWLHI